MGRKIKRENYETESKENQRIRIKFKKGSTKSFKFYRKRGEKDKLIANRLKALPEFTEAKTILFYVSFKNEVGTHNLIKEFVHEKTIAVPKTNLTEKRFDVCKLEYWDDLNQVFSFSGCV